MRKFFAAVGRFTVRFRWLVLVVWIVGAAASTQLPSLSSVTKADNTSFLPANAPSMKAAELAGPLAKANLVQVSVVAARAGGPITTTDAQAITRVEAALARVPTVRAVRDLGRSPDGEAEQLSVFAQIPRGGDSAAKTLVAGLRSAIGTVDHGDLAVHLAGDVPSQVDSNAQTGHTDANIQLFASLFVLVLLLIVFRSVLAPFITLLPALVVAQVAGRLVGFAGSHGLQVSQLSQFMLIVLVIGAGTDYGLFLVFRVREEMRAGLDRRRAVERAVERVGESITFSAGTVIAALLSLLIAQFGIYQSLGAPLAIGIGVMLLAGLTLLPALLAIFGRAAFWPSSVAARPAKPGLWGRIAGRIVARPVPTLLLGLVVFGGLALASLGNRPAGFGTALSAPAGSDSAAGNALLATHFPRSAANPTNVIFRLPTSAWSDLTPVARAEQLLASSAEFRGVTGPLDPTGAPMSAATLAHLHAVLGPSRGLPEVPPPGVAVPAPLYQAYRATAQFISPDGRTVMFNTSLTAGDPSTTAALHAVPAVRAAAARVGHQVGATAVGVAGEAPGIYDVSSLSNHDLLRVVPVAVIVIGILLGLVMRSLVAPLYLVASVALSYLAALGVAVVAFIDVGGQGGLTFILPFLMFLFLLALGEDYNILVMTRIREEAHELPLRQAITRAVGATGSTVTSAGLVLAGTFGVLTFAAGGAGGSQVRDIGTGLAVGILMDTFLVRTLLVPSVVALLGRWNWWPSRLAAGPGGPDDHTTRVTPPRVPDQARLALDQQA